jgi:hypothetical protein
MTEQHTQIRPYHAINIQASDLGNLLRITPVSVSPVPSVVLPFRAFRVFRGSQKNFFEGCQRAGLFDSIPEGGSTG